MKKQDKAVTEQDDPSVSYGENFLIHHAGKIITDPHFAIVELIANSWDAGATQVNIEWAEKPGEVIAIEDNGTGMTKEEFRQRWLELNYNRLNHQGNEVQFPKGNRKTSRKAFGKNGIGRHGMFCFGDEYWIEIAKDGTKVKYHVEKSFGNQPFRVKFEGSSPTKDHGTRIYTIAKQIELEEDKLKDLVGSRFVTDPDFKLFVNNKQVTLFDLEHLCDKSDIEIKDVGTITVRRFDCEKTGKTSKHQGVAWWVNRRLVGAPSWDYFAGALLDARSATAKRFTYVVESDCLDKSVKPDWSGFYASATVNLVFKAVYEFITEDLRGLMHDIRKDRKRAALEASKLDIKALSTLSQEHIAAFADEVQIRCPTIHHRDLENMVRVLSKLEKSRSGYSLLGRLAKLDYNDIDALDSLLDEWSIIDAKKVLDELRYRLELIKQLEELVENHQADELHDLQPLFERGLWIFGTEFESISFISNRTLSTIVKESLGGAVLETPLKRPDFVVLPDSSIGVYSCDAYDNNHEVSGLSSVVIIELKRGGFEIGTKEKDQALHYSRELRKSGKIGKETSIIAYVLGASIDSVADEQTTEAKTTIIPRRYNAVLRQAHARTFNLLTKIEASKKIKITDTDLQEVIYPEQEFLIE
jgi:hypothetical protein